MVRSAASGTRSAVLLVTLLLAATVPIGAPAAGAADPTPPPIRHVFVVNLENQSFDQTWGAGSAVPYLSRTLRRRGLFLDHYYAVAHDSLPNYLAQISGQGPSRATQADCRVYSRFRSTGQGADGQLLGDGCVYPARVTTLADQLATRHLTWKGYMEAMRRPCQRPKIGWKDPYTSATSHGAYATRHNPFVYFRSIVDTPACRQNDVPLRRLEQDLSSIATTANYSMITPNLCNDAHDASCPGGRPGGLPAANAWLKTWVPKITSSPAFRQDGLLVITFDEAETGGRHADSSACCTAPKPPNVEQAGITGPGGGRVGAVLLSPFVESGRTSRTPYNHYALLCSIEELFGLPKLGYAGAPGLRCFGPDVYARVAS